MDTPYVTRAEAARLLRCSLATVDRLARGGVLTRLKRGDTHTVLFRTEEVLAIARHGTASGRRVGGHDSLTYRSVL